MSEKIDLEKVVNSEYKFGLKRIYKAILSKRV